MSDDIFYSLIFLYLSCGAVMTWLLVVGYFLRYKENIPSYKLLYITLLMFVFWPILLFVVMFTRQK